MTETEYIRLTNLIKVRCALRIMNDVLPGWYGIRSEDYAKVMHKLWSWEAKMSHETFVESEETQ